MNPELTDAAAEIGVAPEDTQVFQGGADEGDVYVGPGAPTSTLAASTSGGLFDRLTRTAGVGADITRSVLEYKADLYRKAPGELAPLQRRLFDAGFYDLSMTWEDVRQSDYDDDTRQAWDRAVDRAAAFHGAGQKKTLDQVIDEAARYKSENEKAGLGRGGGTSRSKSVTLTHPDDIRSVAMSVSAKTLGKGWNADELDRFVTAYQGMQNTAQTSQNAGGMSTAAPGMEAAAERAARESNPTAAGANDMVGAYGLLMEAMNAMGAK